MLSVCAAGYGPVARRLAQAAPATGAIRAARYLRELRTFPSGHLDTAEYDRAREHRRRMPRSRWLTRRSFSEVPTEAGWRPVGPRPVMPSHRRYQGPFPVAGRVNSAVIAPGQPNTIYIATATGGVWKTVDGGVKWEPLSDGPDWPYLQTNSIAMDPVERNHLYVGTGDFVFAGNGNFSHGFGVMKTTDGGKTWRNLGRQQFGNLVTSKIVIDPSDRRRLLVTTGHGQDQFGNLIPGRVWRSLDAGETWTPVIDTLAHWNNVVLSAKDRQGKRWAYACGISAEGELWRAEGKRPFKKLKLPSLPPAGRLPYYTHIDVACSPVKADTVYLLYVQFWTPPGGGAAQGDWRIFRSNNAGKKWVDITGNFPHGDTTSGNQDNWSQESYDFCIASSHSNGKDIVYVGLIDIAQSIGGKGEWRSIGGPTYAVSRGIPQATTHNDQHCIVVNPSNLNDLLLGNDGGIYRIDQRQNPPAITGINGDLQTMQCYKLDIDPLGQVAIAGMQDNGTSLTGAGDRNVMGGDGTSCVIDPSNPSRQVGSFQNLQVRRTTDSWGTSQSIGPAGVDKSHVGFIAPLALDAGDPNVLYGADNRLFRWDFSVSLTPSLTSAQKLSSNKWVQTLAVSSCDGNRLYAGSADGEVWTSDNRGGNWRRIDGATLPERAITSIMPIPGDHDGILVGLSGFGAIHLWKCDDVTRATPVWTPVSGSGEGALPDIPLNAIAADPWDPREHWFVAMDVGVYETRDAGASWANASEGLGLPNVLILDLKATTGALFASTYGRGIWRIDLAKPAYEVTPLSGPAQALLLPTALNDSGVVVGYGLPAGDTTHAFRWTPIVPNGATGTLQDLGTPPNGIDSVATGVNGSGDYAGFAQIRTGEFTSRTAGILNNALLPNFGHKGEPQALNDRREIAGSCQLDNGLGAYHAAYWPGAVDLHPLVSQGLFNSGASDINNGGQVAGSSWNPDMTNVRAWLLPNARGPAVDLGAGTADGLNNCGHVVGHAAVSGRMVASLWRNGKRFSLGTPDSALAAVDLNDVGEILLNSADNPTQSPQPLVWRHYVLWDVQRSMDPASGWQLGQFFAINNAGQMCGWATQLGTKGGLRAVLLSPIRE